MSAQRATVDGTGSAAGGAHAKKRGYPGKSMSETLTAVPEAGSFEAGTAAAAEASRPVRGPGGGTSRESRRFTLRVALAVLWLVISGAATAAGFRYYLTPFADRPFSAGHALYAPTGLVGHSLGIAGAAMMLVGVGMYMARKRIALLAGWGRLGTWLDVHIFLCTLGPYLVLLHTSFRFGGLVAIAFWSMAVVVASGVFGRFLYGHIPKTVHGQFRSLASIEQNRAGIERSLRDIGLHLTLAPASASVEARPGLLTAVIDAVRFDLTRHRREAAMRLRLARSSVPQQARDRLVSLLLEEERIRHQISWLKPFQRLFRYWHVFHLPLAIVMLLVLAVHIGVAVAFGYGWPL
jgi:hypothetical protein